MRISRKNRKGRRNRNSHYQVRPLPAALPFPPHPRNQLSRQLLRYRQDWVFDHSRFKFRLPARQTGKDFSAAYEGIRDCLRLCF